MVHDIKSGLFPSRRNPTPPQPAAPAPLPACGEQGGFMLAREKPGEPDWRDRGYNREQCDGSIPVLQEYQTDRSSLR